ncbi:hypothetical protein [Ramlibacter sp. WS9]|uniref:phosphoribosyltransferase-like protein n=1 Tax=Ramlibacter sp. WS9 TaxID=1882741 RepID=UPI0011450BD7|nr:hypothetical protein [Ramlibacter sp. WS9]ROZ69367.1 hypothetical protein EEB15_22875 [Ramlibacter sp. WS9]
MSERDELLESVAKEISSYRAGEIVKPDVAHVARWLDQFTPEAQLPFLREFNHVLDQSFIAEEGVLGFLEGILTNEKLTGGAHCDYWRKANLLKIQQDGQSQRSMLKHLDKALQDTCGIALKDCGSPDGDIVYIDDIIFSGGRVGTDLDKWIREAAPQKAVVKVIVIAYHKLGIWQLENRLKKAAAEAKKDIGFTFWRLLEVENRKTYRWSSQVLWPTELPQVDVVQAYVAGLQKFPFEARAAGGPLGIFSSEAGRQILEREFLIAGARIHSQGNVSAVNRPLGHGYFGLGFGSTLVTHRNCPNNCPLALWWGDPTATSGALKWYPLLPRKNYSSAENVFGKFFD